MCIYIYRAAIAGVTARGFEKLNFGERARAREAHSSYNPGWKPELARERVCFDCKNRRAGELCVYIAPVMPARLSVQIIRLMIYRLIYTIIWFSKRARGTSNTRSTTWCFFSYVYVLRIIICIYTLCVYIYAFSLALCYILCRIVNYPRSINQGGVPKLQRFIARQ